MRNLALLTDFYQLTMMNGYLKHGLHEDTVVFDLFFRKNPCNGSYTIIAGIEQVIDYIETLSFTEEDLNYLRGLGFDDDFLKIVKDFKFSGTIYAVPEGSIMFPGEPILRVKASCLEAQLIETALLNIVNFQSLIATKASRICEAAEGDPVFEFGLRRAQGPDAGIYGARAAVIGGCSSTSNVLAGKMFDIPVVGTQAHSWIQSFDTELEAFRAYAATYPNNCLLLVDTYDTLKTGLPNAITVFNELRDQGYEPKGIRIDSGDIAYLSKEARKILNAAGFENVSIVASSDLDEEIIYSLKIQKAAVTGWGVGTNLITSKGCPALGGVYKLSYMEKNGEMLPKIKISENPEKITNPGYKKVIRIYHADDYKAQGDLIMLEEETIDTSKPLTIFHPTYTWKTKTFTNYKIREMLVPLYIDGKLVVPRKTVKEIKAYVAEELDSLWPEYKRLIRPQLYKVDLSEKLWNLKNDMVSQYREAAKRGS
ncbi:nicotinate phosphoribosyltransferase PncB [Clostridium aceticum]|uniref:Nicotinate phosphoribosyltransferase n=1 Tax=Clostridium aceticum TaxID=84022 RepID=A0A0D8IAX4_9CLOT|nr:nicotinate phosphoribosyltransferase [Clostridium aceticum]AKL93598.1 nicotinate phosphoribosyltransferase PncB [Clostridium aceticum]KJF27187.1 nicotinate phosphoribosyltransferase [Clostridium aceticum]